MKKNTRRSSQLVLPTGSSVMVSCPIEFIDCLLSSLLSGGEGYVEDGREIFDDEDEYEVQSNTNKRKSAQRKKSGKLPDEPVAKKKSLKNFFAASSGAKEKGAASVEDDNLLKNILGDLESSVPSSSGSSASVAPKPIRSIRKQATESEIEMKKYMDKLGKKVTETKKKNDTKNDVSCCKCFYFPFVTQISRPQDILTNLLKEERKAKVKDNKENDISITNTTVHDNVDEIPPTAPVAKKESKKEQEERERLELSMIADGDFFMEDEFEEAEKPPVKATPVVAPPKPVVAPAKPAPKALTANYNGFDSAIFNELQGIDFDAEFNTVEELKLDSSTEAVKFFFLDAWCDNNKPGEVYLFGKVEVPGDKTVFNSICVRVENVNRHLYLLPRTHVYDVSKKADTEQEVTIADVFTEFDEKIVKQLSLLRYDSKKVSKSFAFTVPGVDVPIESEYLEVIYAGKFPTPNTKTKYATIAHIFGTNTSPVETFLLERKIKGPCWLEIKPYKVIEALSSWTKNQVSCTDMSCVSVLVEGQQKPPPPLSVVTVNVKCILNPANNRNEIVQISCLVHDRFRLDRPNDQLVTRQYCGITRPSNKVWPHDMQAELAKFRNFKIFKFENERALLSWFLSIYQNIDPDLIVTFDSNDCQLDIICNRITFLKIPMWSRIGRLKINTVPGKRVNEFFIGRMVCDVKLSATELIKSRSYDLGSLCQKILKIGEDERQEIFYDNIPFVYDKGESIIDFVKLNVQDCIYITKLMVELNILPLALQITNVAGNLMSRTLQGGRSERNEFLLMHAFYEKQYIVPDKKLWKDDREENEDSTVDTQAGNTTTVGAGKKKAAYTGGLVLDPIKGFYESFVLLMDFNSLYPSIIQEYNICYTTIAPTGDPNELPPPPDASVELGILPRQIRRLVESRRNVKQLMSKPNLTPELKMQYNIRQMALKLTANSMYGCLGFSKSRFYAPHLAALVTCKGRDILMATKTLVERLNHNVIYGDTDSIMINTNSQDFEEVYKIGANIKKAVNGIYKHVELDIDGVYQKLLLLKKKKYAAVAVSQKQPGKLEYSYEFKGLDIVRRDWSKIASNTGKVVLDILLSNSGKEMNERVESIFEVLADLAKDLEEEKIPLPMLEITKQLTKAPSEYADMSSLPHVQVADRMNTQKNRRFKKGDMIDYIICEDGTENAAPKRGYHIDEIKGSEDKKLKPDKLYYLSQQVHPVICRLLEPIDGCDAAAIAEKLGLDPNEFRSKVKAVRQEESDGDQMIKTNEQKYRDCEKFMFPCNACKTINVVASPYKRNEASKVVSVFEKCSNKDCSVRPLEYLPAIKNRLKIEIAKAISRFYENWFVCDNAMCSSNTQKFAWVSSERVLFSKQIKFTF